MTRKQQRASEAIPRKGVWWRGFAALTCVAKGDPVCRLQCMMLFSTSFWDLTLNVSKIGTNLKMPGQRNIWFKVLYPSTIPSVDSSPWSSSSDFSCLNNPINVVATKNTIPQKWKNPENATTPFGEGCVLRYLLLKSAEVRPKNTAFPMKNPERWPTVSQVEAYPTFSLDSNVSDQPSTAMSWVAARKFRQKKIAVRKRMLGLSSLFSSRSTSMCWKTRKDNYIVCPTGTWSMGFHTLFSVVSRTQAQIAERLL